MMDTYLSTGEVKLHWTVRIDSLTSKGIHAHPRTDGKCSVTEGQARILAPASMRAASWKTI